MRSTLLTIRPLLINVKTQGDKTPCWLVFIGASRAREKVTSDLIEVVSLKEELPTQGRVAFTAPWIEELGLKVGDVVGFQENRDYRIKIDGQEYYRTRTEDLLYVVQE